MPTFNKYPSIESATHEKDMLYFQEYLMRNFSDKKITWNITEKIHGTNTGIIYDPVTDSVTVQSRGHILCKEEVHYNSKKLAAELLPKIRQAWDYIRKNAKYIVNTKENSGAELKYITIFGEVYGGTYPMQEVEKDKDAIKVQKGIYYSQHNQFRAFDILLGWDIGLDTHATTYLSANEFFKVCKEVGIDTVPILANNVESLTEALKYPNNNTSLIFTLNGLPKPTITENRMEGVVIKPCEYDLYAGEHRIIIKNKNPEFSEECKEGGVKEVKEVSAMELAAINKVLTFITENRLNNVVSHFADPPTIKNFREVMQEYSKDIMDAFSKEDEYKALGKDELKTVQKCLGKEAAIKVKEYFCKNTSFMES